jgi:hypothetical protein
LEELAGAFALERGRVEAILARLGRADERVNLVRVNEVERGTTAPSSTA